MQCVLCLAEIDSAWPHMMTMHKIARPDGMLNKKYRARPNVHREVKVSRKIVRPVIEVDGACAHTASQVYDSRKQGDGSVWRRRRCLGCQERYTTFEVIVR